MIGIEHFKIAVDKLPASKMTEFADFMKHLGVDFTAEPKNAPTDVLMDMKLRFIFQKADFNDWSSKLADFCKSFEVACSSKNMKFFVETEHHNFTIIKKNGSFQIRKHYRPVYRKRLIKKRAIFNKYERTENFKLSEIFEFLGMVFLEKESTYEYGEYRIPYPMLSGS